MRYSCLHTHTKFCDGADDVETMCQAAWKKGFVSLGFSSHAPLTKKTGIATDWHLKDQDLEWYIETVSKAKKTWEGKLKVYLSLEVDFIEGLCGPKDADFQALPLDYIIGSVHYVASPKNGALFTVDCPAEEFSRGLTEYFEGDGEELFKAYYRANCRCIQSGGFDILAHPDLVKKNNGEFHFFSPENPLYVSLLRETAAELAAARNLPQGRTPIAELNTGGMIRGKIAEPYPSAAMLGFFKAFDIPLTINADAHAADHLGGYYEEARDAMLKAGYTTTVFFEGQANGKALWREEAL